MDPRNQTCQLQDCFISTEGELLTVGNRRICRTFDMRKGAFGDITDRLAGRVYP